MGVDRGVAMPPVGEGGESEGLGLGNSIEIDGWVIIL